MDTGLLLLVVILLCVVLIGLSTLAGVWFGKWMDEQDNLVKHIRGTCVPIWRYDQARQEVELALRASRNSPKLGQANPRRQLDQLDAELRAYAASYGIDIDKLLATGEEVTDDMDMKVTQTMGVTCVAEGYDFGYIGNYGSGAYQGATRHRVTLGDVFLYLQKNPTLDESQPPMMYSKNCYQVAAGKATVEAHEIPFDKLRAFIEQHPALMAVYSPKPPEPPIVRAVALDLTEEQRAEMTIALHRQQHIRNEYVRRAYVACKNSAGTGNESVYTAELDAQLAGLNTLRNLMESLDIPADDWMNSELALAQMAMLDEKEAQHGESLVHGTVSGSDGGSGLASGTNRAAGSGSATGRKKGRSVVVQ